MKKLLASLFASVLLISTIQAAENSVENALFDLPDVVFKEIRAESGFEHTFELHIKQYIDHQHPEKGTFYQRAYLSHRGFDKPMVMYISGYTQGSGREMEMAKLLDANQLSIEHRYFGESMPDTLDYNYLNLEQATADLHHINELFKQLYTNKWVSMGISKGGATVIFYKYFYPNDVDAGVPYVAPINKEFEEHRIYTFLDTVGTDECRAKLLAFQKRMFHHRDEILPMLELYAQGAKLKFTHLSLEEAFELAVLEYPFSFWQWGSSESDIPAENSSLVDAVKYLMDVSGIDFWSDRDVEAYLSHYYQSAAQMGYYGYETKNFKDDLKALPLKPNPHAAIVPDNIPWEFDGSLLKKINKWTQTEGDHLLYIYGAKDTWSASSVPATNKVDSQWFMMKDKSHGTARVRNMTPAEKERFISTLERWLDLKIPNPDLK